VNRVCISSYNPTTTNKLIPRPYDQPWRCLRPVLNCLHKTEGEVQVDSSGDYETSSYPPTLKSNVCYGDTTYFLNAVSATCGCRTTLLFKRRGPVWAGFWLGCCRHAAEVWISGLHHEAPNGEVRSGQIQAQEVGSGERFRASGADPRPQTAFRHSGTIPVHQKQLGVSDMRGLGWVSIFPRAGIRV